LQVLSINWKEKFSITLKGWRFGPARVRKQKTDRHDAQLKLLLELNLARDDYRASLGLVWRVIQQSEMVRSLKCTQNPVQRVLDSADSVIRAGHFSAAAAGLYRQPF
jgi:hypothetical protein